MSTERPLLAVRGVARRFGAQVALRPTDFEVWDGELVALIGPNGAGKSTLLAILAGGLSPSEGRVERRPGVRLGWVPQRPAYYGKLTARENLELFARLERESDPAGAAERLLAAFELPSDRPTVSLSVGNRQRLNLAIALLGNPDALLLDEPTAALDPSQRRRLWDTVVGLREAGGAAVFVTQDLVEVERHADRVVALREGIAIFGGTWDEYEAVHEDVFA